MPPAPHIQLDLASGIPAGRQIVNQLRTLIVEGALKPGDALPPVRTLAMDLGIHFNTVAEAYRTLAKEEFLEIVHGHGARVAGETPLSRASHPGPDVLAEVRSRLRELVAAARARGLSTRRLAGELRLLADRVENYGSENS